MTYEVNGSTLSPARLDKILHDKINDYLVKSNLTKLAKALDQFVREQYHAAYEYVVSNGMDLSELEKHIKSQSPGRTYLRDYVHGRPICYRYTNTIANFFKVNYQLGNHNPCNDLLDHYQNN